MYNLQDDKCILHSKVLGRLSIITPIFLTIKIVNLQGLGFFPQTLKKNGIPDKSGGRPPLVSDQGQLLKSQSTRYMNAL